MTKIKLLCCDVDATLVNDLKTIPEENIKAIQKAYEKGVHFTILSGRNTPSVRSYLNEIGIRETVPALGGCIVQSWNGDLIAEHTIEKSIAKAIFLDMLKNNCTTFLYNKDTWYLNPGNDYWAKSEYNATKTVGNIVDIPTLLNTLSPNKMLLADLNTEKVIKAKEIIDSKYSNYVDTFLSSPSFLEIMPKGVNKGQAVKDLCSYYKISEKEVMVIGDYYNDLHMFKVAGISVAMANSPDDVKTFSTWVTTKDNNNGGVAEAIEKFILSC
ncbi:MAG: HAD family hydrolase [Sphaerochaetaceae bacterium]|nr:HAD family hydrolase [Sphaerochaetaceae bacterium]